MSEIQYVEAARKRKPMSSYGYKVAWCSICNRSWLEIVKEKETGRMFVSCFECGSECDSPQDVYFIEASTQGKNTSAEIPEFSDVVSKGWDGFIVKVGIEKCGANCPVCRGCSS